MTVAGMCIAQTSCAECPIGKELRTMPLDCAQFIALFPEKTAMLAQAWKEAQSQ